MVAQRPEYRRRLLRGLDITGGVTILRAVEVLSVSGAPSIKDVAARLAVEHSTSSRGVDSAVRSGLLSKQPCADDQRRSQLALTTQGRDVLRKTSARRRERIDYVTERWPTEDIARLIELLDALRVGFDRLEHPT